MPSWPRGLWAGLPQAERRGLKADLRALEARLGPFTDRLMRTYARLVVEAGWTAQEASSAAVSEALKRRQGRGRRPTRQAVDRRLKRQGLGFETFDRMLARLEALAGARAGGRSTSPSPEELVAALRVHGASDGDA